MDITDTPDELFDALTRARQIAEFWRESGSRFQAIAALEQYCDARERLLDSYRLRTVRSVDNA